MMPGEQVIKPRYDAGGFAGIPERLRENLTSGNYDAVVLFLVDGFGWRFVERFQDAPFLKRLVSGGQVEKLTSQFPSTTAAHITTIHTGLPVGEHGVFEWFYYEPLLDRMIAPLLFSPAGDLARDLLKSQVDARRIYPTRTLYNSLRESGITSHIFGVRDYTPSTYSNIVMHGARLHSFKTLSEALVNIQLMLEKRSGTTLIHLYFDKVDSLCHEYGPDAPQTEAEIETFLLIMEHFFTRIFSGGRRVLFMMTADHGAEAVDPKQVIYLNTQPQFSGVERFLKTNQAGDLLVPGGSARDMFLYVRDDLLDEAQAFIARGMQGRAEVVKVADLISGGWFGGDISPIFRARVGNLVILPHAGESTWWYVKDRFEQRFRGHHGGLTPREMEIPLFTCAAG
jgi:predicted AlkP superfamily pyrophosphatase or phosphodiesterase